METEDRADTRPELHCDVHGGTGPYLLLVHGFLSGRSQWIPNLPALRHVARPVVIEMWGHGRSPSPERPSDYEPEGYLEAFERIREHLGAERWWICGQSLGATLTLRYALTRPDRILGHVFTNTNSGLSDAEWTANRRKQGEEMGARMARGLESIEDIEAHPRHARRLPADVRTALLEDAELHDRRGIAGTMRYTNADTLIRERLASNRVPTLLVSGERESRFLPLREFVEVNMPNLTVARTEGGHSPNIDAHEAWNHAVVDFIRAQVDPLSND